MTYAYQGVKPKKYDARDFKVRAAVAEYPAEFELDISQVKILNQNQVNSCVAHATRTILEYHALKDQKQAVDLSTNFIYGLQASECGQMGQGMYLQDACKIVQKYGDMLHNDCMGNNEVPTCYAIAESAKADEEKAKRAYEYRIMSYANCENLDAIKNALMNYGLVLASVKWTKYRLSKEGVINFLGGDFGYHAAVIYGWNEKGLKCINSWGSDWGNNGTYILPYEWGVAEAKALIDYDNPEEIKEDTNIIVPKRNIWLDIVYKVINILMNFIKN